MRNILFLLVFLSACGQAQDDELRDRLEAGLQQTFNDVSVTAIREIPVEGMVEVELNGQDRVYATRDGRFLFTGTLLELTDGGVENLTENRLSGVRQQAIAKLDGKEMITFEAADEKAEVYAFTDVSCGYCRRLHQDMNRLNAMGITVHYLAFPRGGMGTGTASLMQQVWCADDRASAITEAKLSGSLSTEDQSCDDPVAEQYKLGISMGVRGTPAIFTPAGEQLGGYLPPEKLARALGLDSVAAAD